MSADALTSASAAELTESTLALRVQLLSEPELLQPGAKSVIASAVAGRAFTAQFVFIKLSFSSIPKPTSV
jgi:hypothetical protein